MSPSVCYDQEQKIFMEEVVGFHAIALNRVGYPGYFDNNFSNYDSSIHIGPVTRQPYFFFVLDKRLPVSDLDYKVIKYLTILSSYVNISNEAFLDCIGKNGDKYLILLESYNHEAFDFVSRFIIRKTYYCQQKLLCSIKELEIKQVPMLKDIIIRNFVAGYDELGYANFYNTVLGFLGDKVDETFVETIVKRPSFNATGYFLAELGEEIIGFLSIEKEPWGERNTSFGYIYQIGISDEWRKSGLAEILLSKAIEFAKENGIDRIGVGIRKSNLPAMGFFLKHGFKVAYENTGYIVDFNKTNNT